MLFPCGHSDGGLARVVITGVGVVSAYGSGWEANALGFRDGRVAVKRLTLFDVSRQRAQVAAEATVPSDPWIDNRRTRNVSRGERAAEFLLNAASAAWRQAGWTPRANLPVVLGTTSGGMSLGEAYFRAAADMECRRHQPGRVLHYQAQRQALNLQEVFQFTGPLTIIANACASGANAMGHAWELLRHRRAEQVLAGAYEALSQMVFAGFDSLQALSPTRCRPFDRDRDGLALGEGAAVLALETLDSARRRGANILGEIVGYGATTDAHHLTQPHPEGEAAYGAMRAACQSAQLSPEQIGYVNAHGTGTPLNDSAEAAAINRWAGAHTAKLPVSSTKSGIGHLLGAAGAVETVVCLMALKEQWLPPTSTLENPDPVCGFQVVREPTEDEFQYAMSNSFGFGGANASLILRRWL